MQKLKKKIEMQHFFSNFQLIFCKETKFFKFSVIFSSKICNHKEIMRRADVFSVAEQKNALEMPAKSLQIAT